MAFLNGGDIMPRNPNPYYWTYGIPAFNVAHKFVYMNDLATLNLQNSYWIANKKQQLYNDASSMAATVGAEIGIPNTGYMKSAFEFLDRAAASERAKELMVIRNYKNQLFTLLGNPSKEFQQLLNNLENGTILNKPQSLTNFYLELTKYINVVRQSLDEARQRLADLKTHMPKAITELYKDEAKFRMTGDISALLNNVIGTATRSQETKADSFASYVRRAAKEYIINSDLISRLQSGEDIAAAMSVIAMDFEQKMQEELRKRKLNDFTDLVNDGIIDKLIENYTNAEEQYQTRLQQTINNNQAELDNILLAAKHVLNITSITGTKAREARKIEVDRRSNSLNFNTSLSRQLNKEFAHNKNIEDLKYIEFSLGDPRTAHGNIFELFNIVQHGNTIKIQSNAGADLLSLGSFEFLIQSPDLQNQFMPFIKEIEKIITKYEKTRTIDRKKDQSDIQKQMTDEINEQIKKMENLINNLKLPLDDLFVYHESLKLYKTAESNESFKGFHGRDLNAIAFLDKLYSMDGIPNSGLDLPSRANLDFLMLNLAQGAVGHNLKSTVEDYLSIFAGLLMFDDVKSIADDAIMQIKGTQLGAVKQIHLYNLNGIYVPGSLFLSFVSESMKLAGQQLESNQIARASIDASGANESINKYLASRPKPLKEQWEIVGNQVAQGTKIRLTIFKAFGAFMSALTI